MREITSIKRFSPVALAVVFVVVVVGYVIAHAHASGLVGDINNDGTVNVLDVSALLSDWGTSIAAADLNSDGTVNIFDLSALLSHWGGQVPAFTLGTTQPDATNTGYGVLGYTPSTLVDMPKGDLVITTDGTVVEGKRIHGMVRIHANNVTIRGCEIVSYPSHPYIDTSDYGLVSSNGTGNVIEYNSITQYDPSTSTDNSIWWMVGVLLPGGSTTVYRNNIHDVNDLVYTTGGTQQIQGNYMHDPGFRTDDQDQANSSPAYYSHNDGVQVMGGTSHVIDGNSIEMKWSTQTGMNSTVNPNPSAEQVWPNAHGIIMQTYNAALTGVQITRNWFKYGSVAVRFAPGNHDPGGAPTITGNRITPDQGKEFSQYVQISIDPTTSWPSVSVDSSNVYSNDSDTPLAWRGLSLKAPTTVGTTKTWAYNASTHTP